MDIERERLVGNELDGVIPEDYEVGYSEFTEEWSDDFWESDLWDIDFLDYLD